MEGVTLAFESKHPHTTPWLSIEWPVGEEPVELLAKLAELEWVENPLFEARRLPPLDGIQEVNLSPPKGSDIFYGWKPAEAKKHMPAVRRLLRQYGFDRVPWNRLELVDLI